jgi:hypothetical protein
MAAAVFKFIGMTDLHYFYRFLLHPPAYLQDIADGSCP